MHKVLIEDDWGSKNSSEKNCEQNRCGRQFQTLMILEAVADRNGPERERKETGTLHDTISIFFFLFFYSKFLIS